MSGDGRDPQRASAERLAGETTLYGRKIALHLSDGDNSGWGSIDNGDPGDEVWLDRSFNSGKDWQGRLGKTQIPENGRSWRTMMYGVHDLEKREIGALRACGKAGNRKEVSCTEWFRTNPGTRADAAATSLMSLYNKGNGKWNGIGWWNTANAMTAMLDYMLLSKSKSYDFIIANTFDKNKGDNFLNDYMDDSGWWGLAWIRAFDITGDTRYLEMAKRVADYLWSFKDGKCGGGVWWRDDKRYKNAVTNELFIKLAAEIHTRSPGDTKYLGQAKEVWGWFKASGMINAQHLINDGLDFDTCKTNGQTTWTYNQGIVLGALVELHRATGDKAYLDEARTLADASTRDAALNPNGILREPCEGDDCGKDAPTFKGVYVRNLGELDRALGDHPYRAYLQRQADAVHSQRSTLDMYGLRWGKPVDQVDASRQHSALEALTAALP